MDSFNSSLLISQREKILLIYRFQTSGLNVLRLRSSVSTLGASSPTLPIKILAKATAFLFPWQFRVFVGNFYHRTGMSFLAVLGLALFPRTAWG